MRVNDKRSPNRNFAPIFNLYFFTFVEILEDFDKFHLYI